MTIDDLEALIWQTLTRYTRRSAPGDVAVILRGAETYAAAQGGITAERRAALAGAQSTVHWQRPGAAPRTAACHGRRTRARVSACPGQVTCGTCREGGSWQAAASAGRESEDGI